MPSALALAMGVAGGSMFIVPEGGACRIYRRQADQPARSAPFREHARWPVPRSTGALRPLLPDTGKYLRVTIASDHDFELPTKIPALVAPDTSQAA